MTAEGEKNERYEHRIVRIPYECRKRYNIDFGEFIYLRSADGGVLAYQVAEAYKEDVAEDPLCMYVTRDVYKNLQVTDGGRNEIARVDNIMLGCDPETFLVDMYSGSLVFANRYFSKQGVVGHDGLLLEFRPYPNTDASVVCHNIWQAIQATRRMLSVKPEGPRIMLLGRSSFSNLSAGFHLHYGLPQRLLGFNKVAKQIAILMARPLDYYVGIPAMLPEGNFDTGRRVMTVSPYGKPGQFRLDNRTYEWRMAGGANLKHPILTMGLLSLGAVVVEDVVSRISECTDCFVNMGEITRELDLTALYPNLPGAQTLYSVVCNPDIAAAAGHMTTIKDDVRQMLGYKYKANEIEKYFQCVENLRFGDNIEQNWGGFYNEEQQRQMVVL